LLRTLVANGYLAVNPVDRRYRLGQRLGNCARVYAMSASVASLVRPCLERLRLRTQETVTVQTRSGVEQEVQWAIYCPVPDYNNASVQFVVGVQGPEFRLSEKELEIVAQLKVVALELADAIPPDAPIR
jgi:DNA-binding IclR family transcriptional regulator